ncbi:MAG: hypothetical protein JXR84_08465 [Anaerolineae bacterium]|nr:hypothetical protein [Anaerolineae bacterium]
MALKGLAARQQSAAPPAVDPENRDWVEDAATNTAALTAKQRYDLKRVRAYYDLHAQEMDDVVAEIADSLHTSKSQVASYLLAFALNAYCRSDDLWEMMTDAKSPSRSLRYEWELEIERDWIEAFRTFLHDGPDRRGH